MILRRLGNKTEIASKIYPYFAPHKIRIIPFFGAGGDYFNMPKAKMNYLNDLDSNVYNCFDVLIRKKQELLNYIELIPYHIDFWNECKTRKPENDIEKAVYFLVLSSFGYLGLPINLKFDTRNPKDILINNIEKTYKQLVISSNKFLNCDFRDILSKISFDRNEKNETFIYSDPPYLDCVNNYNMEEKWTKKDVIDCMDFTFNSGVNAAMSEFNHEFIIEEAKKRNLEIITIGDRKNIKNHRIEILLLNYKPVANLFFSCS